VIDYSSFPGWPKLCRALGSLHQMKKLLLLAGALPSLALAVPIHLDGPNSDFTAFTSSGYRVEHSAGSEQSSGLGRWWVSFFSAPGTGFDAYSFGGDVANYLPDGGPSAVLVQGETVGGEYFSEIFRFKPHAASTGLLTASLNDHFRNLSWLRISGFGSGNEFALKDLGVNGVEPVPEAGPGLLLMALALSGLMVVYSTSRKSAANA
jgi:hypothetical protein